MDSLKLFEGLHFTVDGDVDGKVVAHVETEGGLFRSSGSFDDSSQLIWLVNQDCADVTSRTRPNTTYIFQNWVNMCMLRRMRVDHQPYTLLNSREVPSSAVSLLTFFAQVATATESTKSIIGTKMQYEASAPAAVVAGGGGGAYPAAKKVRGDRYTEQEDEMLWTFATVTHSGSSMTQEELWRMAENEGLLENRSWISMRKRYRELKQTKNVFDKSNQSYTKADDSAILRWAWLWKHTERRGEAASGKIWEIASQRQIVMGREASQMYRRYKRLVEKFETTEKLMDYAATFECLQEDKWGDIFQPKPNENANLENH